MIPCNMQASDEMAWSHMHDFCCEMKRGQHMLRGEGFWERSAVTDAITGQNPEDLIASIILAILYKMMLTESTCLGIEIVARFNDT